MKKIFLFSLIYVGQFIFANQEIKVQDGVILLCENNKVTKINMTSPHQIKVNCVSVGLDVGETCQEDMECTSKCCGSNSICKSHDPENGAFCSKSPGQSCISSEHCKYENVPTCFVVKIGGNAYGKFTCTLRCYNKPTQGICNSNKVCTPPISPDIPDFDPSNPDCSRAVDPPTIF